MKQSKISTVKIAMEKSAKHDCKTCPKNHTCNKPSNIKRKLEKKAAVAAAIGQVVAGAAVGSLSVDKEYSRMAGTAGGILGMPMGSALGYGLATKFKLPISKWPALTIAGGLLGALTGGRIMSELYPKTPVPEAAKETPKANDAIKTAMEKEATGAVRKFLGHKAGEKEKEYWARGGAGGAVVGGASGGIIASKLPIKVPSQLPGPFGPVKMDKAYKGAAKSLMKSKYLRTGLLAGAGIGAGVGMLTGQAAGYLADNNKKDQD